MDTFSNMFQSILNAQAVNKNAVIVPYSKMKMAVLDILKKENFLIDFAEIKQGTKQMIKINLKYEQGKPRINKIRRISKPGRRIYIKKNQIPRVVSGFGMAIISTPQGIVSGNEAKKKGQGGELIAEVW